MTITTDAIVDRTKSKDSEQVLQDDIDTAAALLTAFIDDAAVESDLPPVIYDAAHLAVALQLYNQRKARNGTPNQQYQADGVTIAEPPVSRDPLVTAYPILRDFVSPVRFA